MKAILVKEFGGPEVMQIAEIDTPTPTGTQVLVKVEAAGVNPVETYIRAGVHAIKPTLPFTPGKDGAGVVESVGDSVTRFKPGDRVYTANSISGTYAEYSICEESDLGILPDIVAFAAGAGIWTPYATAFRALFQKANARAGESVLIHGASGGVGIAAIQWAKMAGLFVVGTASSDAGRELVVSSGADLVFDHTDPQHLSEIASQTGGVNIIIEMLANENLERDFDAIKMFGRIVIVGNRGSIQFTPRLAMTKDVTISGMSLFNSTPSDRDEIHKALAVGLANGHLSPPVSTTLSLADAPMAHEKILNEKAAGKIILIP